MACGTRVDFSSCLLVYYISTPCPTAPAFRLHGSSVCVHAEALPSEQNAFGRMRPAFELTTLPVVDCVAQPMQFRGPGCSSRR